MRRSILPGQVWTVDDSLVTMSADLRDDVRYYHDPRFVVAVIGEKQGRALSLPFMLCVPITRRLTSGVLGKYEVELAEGTAGLTEDSVAPVYLMQPIAKDDVTECHGAIPDSKYKEILAVFLQFVGAELASAGNEQ